VWEAYLAKRAEAAAKREAERQEEFDLRQTAPDRSSSHSKKKRKASTAKDSTKKRQKTKEQVDS